MPIVTQVINDESEIYGRRIWPQFAGGTRLETNRKINSISLIYSVGFPDGSVVKNLSAMQEMWVQSLDWEDPLEKEMAIHSSIFAWKIHGRLQSMGLPRVRHD